MRRSLATGITIAGLLLPLAASARTYDVSVTRAGVTFVPATFFLGDRVRIYVEVQNVGDRDVEGAVFFSENGTAIGTPPPFSAKARGLPEEVWVEWQPAVDGERQVTIRVISAPETRDEDQSNNEMIVPVMIDRDTDRDGIGDREDPDDDNDGLPDTWESSHGLNPRDPGDAARDPDGDGRTTVEEFRAGTDPFAKPPAAAASSKPQAGGGGSGGSGASVFGGGTVAPPSVKPAAPSATSALAPSANPGAAPPRPKPSTPKPPAEVAGVKVTAPVPSRRAPGVPSGDRDLAIAIPSLAAPTTDLAPSLDRQLAGLLGDAAPWGRRILPIAAGAVAFASAMGLLLLFIRRRAHAIADDEVDPRGPRAA